MSKPLLKIGPLTSLQDARSSAAVGFELVTFSLERGSNQKLSVSMIWNIVQWLSGPEIVLELNRFSLEELKDVEGVFEYQYLSVPIEEYGSDLLELPGKLILRADETSSPSELEDIFSQVPADKLWIELSVSSKEEAQAYQAIFPRIFLHETSFPEHPSLFSTDAVPLGYSLKQEAEEEAGVLDYEAVDVWVEGYNEAFDEE